MNSTCWKIVKQLYEIYHPRSPSQSRRPSETKLTEERWSIRHNIKMAVTVLSVAISCSRSAGSPGSLVTMPEVMIITEGFNPTCSIEIYETPWKKEENRRERTKRDRPYQKEKPTERTLGEKRGGESEKRAEDDDIDCVLDPAFASTAISRLPTPQEGGTRWPLVGLPGPGRVYVS